MTVAAPAKETLAIDGGAPVREAFLPYGRHSIDEADIQAIVETLRSDWLTTGPKVAEFEEAFAERVGASCAVSFSSGTAALHGAIFAAGIGPGDEVITSPLTFAATANCVLYQGGRPVFADVRSGALNINPAEVAHRLTNRTRALLPVDYAGHPADLAELTELADYHGLIVIEDACHALGAEYHGRRVGSIAHMTAFSFHPVKHLTTGEGGMVTTDSAHFAETLRKFRNHGISSDARQRQAEGRWQYEMVLLGFNYRLSDVASALGISQLRKLKGNLRRRYEIARQYSNALQDIEGIELPSVLPGVTPAWHLYPIRLRQTRLSATRDEIFRALRAENIGVNVHYLPVHLHPYYRDQLGFKRGDYPVAEAAYESLLSLPMFHGMGDADVESVIRAVEKVIGFYAKENPQ
jgi:perosamine synthetase